MKKHLLITVIVLAVGAMGAFAQDQPAAADVFDTSAFDQSVQQSIAPGQTEKPEILFGGSFVSDTSLSSSTDFAWYTAAGSFSGKVFSKITVPDYGSLYIGYLVSHALFKGAAGTLPAGAAPLLATPADALYTASYSLSELYYSFDIAHSMFFRLGNQLIAWGPSLIWTPVDFINLQKADPLSTIDRRAGKPGLRVLVPLGPANVFLFGDFSGTVTAAGVQDPLAATNLAARVDLTALGFELALTGYWGSSLQSRYGFDFSGRLLGFDVYGELAAAFPYDSYSLTYAGSVGFQRTFCDLGYWGMAGEFFYNDSGTTDTAAYPLLIAAGRFTPLYVGRYYAYASITRSHLFIDGLSAALGGFANISDGSYQMSLSTTMSLPKIVPFTLSVRYSGGGAGKELTYFTGDNALSAGLQVRFEF